MIGLAASVLAASVAGSPHCAGMCGGVAMFCGGAGQCGMARSMRATALYHVSRLVGYMLVGCIAGVAGIAVDAGGTLAGMQRAAAMLAGVIVALVGVSMLMRARGGPSAGISMPRWIQRGIGQLHALAVRLPPDARAVALGMLTPLLPCGWLWAFVAVAAGSGSATLGSWVMAVFWLGTLPALLMVGLGAAVTGGERRRWASALAGTLMVVVGVHTAFVRAPLAERALSAQAGVAMDEGAGEASMPPCCRSAEDGP